MEHRYRRLNLERIDTLRNVTNLIGLLIIGLIILGLARKPKIIKDFFSGLQGTLGLLTK